MIHERRNFIIRSIAGLLALPTAYFLKPKTSEAVVSSNEESGTVYLLVRVEQMDGLAVQTDTTKLTPEQGQPFFHRA